jgi:hypothetical protein
LHIAYDTSDLKSITLALVERKESGMDFSLLFDQIIINAKEK